MIVILVEEESWHCNSGMAFMALYYSSKTVQLV